MEYADEPEIQFTPLCNKKYCHFYDIEMSDFTDDVSFYKHTIPSDSTVLELGCGSGRLSRQLAEMGHAVVALDISMEMLEQAVRKRQGPPTNYIRMDMLGFSFNTSFDAIIIPYNTLNLCESAENVKNCLRLCFEHLKSSGKLLLQLYLPGENLTSSTNRSFQFQIFSPPEGGKIIKETLKKYDRDSQSLLLEERYRVRPFQNTKPNEDLHHLLSLYTPEHSTWKNILKDSGFTITCEYGDYELQPVTSTSNILLIDACKG